jgi:hypothetical protein
MKNYYVTKIIEEIKNGVGQSIDDCDRFYYVISIVQYRITSTSGVNFNNVLRTKLLLIEIPNSQKDSQVSSVFSGSKFVKAALKMLMKSNPGVDFINMFSHSFYN